MIDATKQNLVYVTRDIERALGLHPYTHGFHIISNSGTYAKSIKNARENVLLVEEDRPLDTRELLEHADTVAYLNTLKNPRIIVFKNTLNIERICRNQGWTLLNPSAELSNRIEEKISQVAWLDDLSKYLPAHRIMLCKDVLWNGQRFVLQFNRAHTGSGTLLISKADDLETLKKTFPNRPVRVSEFIEAPTYTVNIVVDKKGSVRVSSPSFQITGLSPFTDQPFATVGNDWSLAGKLLGSEARTKIKEIANAVGKKMQIDGWFGLFGIDYLVQNDEVYLMEINARQPASATYESQIQRKNTTCEAHIRAFLGKSLENFDIQKIRHGAQIILRNAKNSIYDIEAIRHKMEKLGLHVLAYENTKQGSDLIRIQSADGLMMDTKQPNESLKAIIELIDRGKSASEDKIESIAQKTRELIEKYIGLPIAGHTVVCPYFNNKRVRLRAALRSLIGKGRPEEIVEEAEIMAMNEKINLADLSVDAVKKFLVDHNLGIDCSGFVFYLLEAELAGRKDISLKKAIRFAPILNPIRLFIRTLRVVENINVQVLASEKNSSVISLKDIQPADFIIILNSGHDSARDHVLFVETVEYKKNTPSIIHYVHSFQWSTDGTYNHGVRRGIIEVVDPEAPLAEQKWIEQNIESEKNETYKRACGAEKVEMRRLLLF